MTKREELRAKAVYSIENPGDSDKKLFMKRFKAIYPDKRLLAVQLNGFSHSVFYDEGKAESDIICESYSMYMPEKPNAKLAVFFAGYQHHYYKHNAQELVFIKLEER